MRKRLYAWTTVAIAFTVLIATEVPMAFGKTVVLFSEFNGVLVDASNNPQPGVRIVRKWKWKEPAQDETVTDKDGRFHLPRVTGTSLLASVLPVKAVITQDIIAHGPEGEVILWSAGKLSFEDNSEMDGRPLNFSCRIDKTPNHDGPYYGTCREITKK